MDGRVDVDVVAGVVVGSGELDLSAADRLRDAIERVRSADDDRAVVIDLRDVTFIDSTGLKELIRPVIDGHRVTLRHPSHQVCRVIQLSGLTDALPVEEN